MTGSIYYINMMSISISIRYQTLFQNHNIIKSKHALKHNNNIEDIIRVRAPKTKIILKNYKITEIPSIYKQLRQTR